MRTLLFLFFAIGSIWFLACNSDDSSTNPLETSNGSTGNIGFGVSGLLFENNLVMWYRENNEDRSELFPQMYYTRSDAANFPVWGTFPAELMVSGGVPRDGIPALINPDFVTPEASLATYLKNSDIVLGAVINGEVKAYPENILWWHEIINDEIGGQKVMMTFCPLTGTGLFFRRPDSSSNINQLELLPVIETNWEKWKELYPTTSVVSSFTGFNRDYTVYPYGGYRSEQTQPLFPLRTGGINNRFPPKHLVLGIIDGSVQKAYPFSRLGNTPVINDTLNNRPILIVSDISAQLVIPYDREVNGQVLTFSSVSINPFQMTDGETNSIWNIKGEAVSGPLSGTHLTQIPAHNAFWFAWAAFWPSTLIYGD
jgi:hypothetical protein